MFPPFLVRSFEFPSGTHVAPHIHRSSQLIYSVIGSMAIQTDEERWYVPMKRGVWMPHGVSHSIQCFGDVSMKTAFIRRNATSGMPLRPCEVAIPDALRELLLDLAEKDMSAPAVPVEHLLEVIKYLCEPVVDSTLAVPLVSARPIRTIVETLLSNPADRTSLDTWADRLALHHERSLGISNGQRECHFCSGSNRSHCFTR